MNLGVLASHEGTTLQSLLDAFAGGRIPGRVSVVVSNNGDSGALVMGCGAFAIFQAATRNFLPHDPVYLGMAPAC
jgi:folate-dependent phosphoribosylglycinamide formyltransferase PurN